MTSNALMFARGRLHSSPRRTQAQSHRNSANSMPSNTYPSGATNFLVRRMCLFEEIRLVAYFFSHSTIVLIMARSGKMLSRARHCYLLPAVRG